MAAVVVATEAVAVDMEAAAVAVIAEAVAAAEVVAVSEAMAVVVQETTPNARKDRFSLETSRIGLARTTCRNCFRRLAKL
jgi:purine-nucleoside phosphorylase